MMRRHARPIGMSSSKAARASAHRCRRAAWREMDRCRRAWSARGTSHRASCRPPGVRCSRAPGLSRPGRRASANGFSLEFVCCWLRPHASARQRVREAVAQATACRSSQPRIEKKPRKTKGETQAIKRMIGRVPVPSLPCKSPNLGSCEGCVRREISKKTEKIAVFP